MDLSSQTHGTGKGNEVLVCQNRVSTKIPRDPSSYHVLHPFSSSATSARATSARATSASSKIPKSMRQHIQVCNKAPSIQTSSLHSKKKSAARAVFSAETKKKKKKRSKNNVRKEMMSLQRSTDLIIPKAPFERLLMEFRKEFKSTAIPDGPRFTAGAKMALRESAEAYLVNLFQNTVKATKHGKRETLMPVDIALVQYFKRNTS